ncbi:DNA polymerase III subunit delta [Patescibacteria group bacterium]|nr:DNA polymerase III subunit delta [Patescibacteria group bacterium]
MILFLYGQDTYRRLQKLNEIVGHYQKIHKSGLNLKYFDFQKDAYENFEADFRNFSMFSEKKLFVLKNVGLNDSFKINFLRNQNFFLDSKDIILFFEDEISERNKLFKLLKKSGKFQEFQPLKREKLKHWTKQKFGKTKIKIGHQALTHLIDYTGNDLWRLSGEIKKLISYKIKEKTPLVTREDIDLLVKPKIELDIFKTVDALALKNKKRALFLIHQHLENGDSPLYLLSMINFQFRNLLLIKTRYQSTDDIRMSRIGDLSRELGMHPYVVKKTLELSRIFSLEELKRIYQKFFQIDLAIKTGKTNPVMALDILVAEI